MAFPDNRADFITYLDQKRVDARTYSLYCQGELDDALISIMKFPDGDIKNACMHLYYAVFYHRGSVARLYDVNLSESPRASLINFLSNFTSEGNGNGEDPYVLTWQDIVKVWGEASDPGKMWTITTLDQLRQNMWNENPQIKWTENPYE